LAVFQIMFFIMFLNRWEAYRDDFLSSSPYIFPSRADNKASSWSWFWAPSGKLRGSHDNKLSLGPMTNTCHNFGIFWRERHQAINFLQSPWRSGSIFSATFPNPSEAPTFDCLTTRGSTHWCSGRSDLEALICVFTFSARSICLIVVAASTK
jgi:hypothetical protein